MRGFITVDEKTDRINVNPIFREREFVFDPKLVFVVMPFGEPWSDRVWEVIQQIVTTHRLRAERADNRHGPIVTEDIWRAIVEARIVLADITGWNPNVFYELGIAHALGKDVVLVSQPTPRLPFDTQGYRHIIYADNPSGMNLLRTEIPNKLDHYLHPTRKPRADRRSAGHDSNASKKAINKSWTVVADNWDPPLPPMETQDLRSQTGAFKKRMRQYVYYLAEPDAQQFVMEMRQAWPNDLDHVVDKDDIKRAMAAIEAKLNEWRVTYSERKMQ